MLSCSRMPSWSICSSCLDYCLLLVVKLIHNENLLLVTTLFALTLMMAVPTPFMREVHRSRVPEDKYWSSQKELTVSMEMELSDARKQASARIYSTWVRLPGKNKKQVYADLKLCSEESVLLICWLASGLLLTPMTKNMDFSSLLARCTLFNKQTSNTVFVLLSIMLCEIAD